MKHWFKKVKMAIVAVAIVTVGLLTASGEAFAQAAGGGATIGTQVQSMAQEFSTAGGFAASMAMYAGSLFIFVASVWHLWQSRQPENRDQGRITAGLAGLVVAGLMVAGGSWINKASMTTTGTNSAVQSTANTITFQ